MPDSNENVLYCTFASEKFANALNASGQTSKESSWKKKTFANLSWY